MRLAIGLILVVVGLVGGYLVITGRFPPASTTPATTGSPSLTAAQNAANGAIQNLSGSGGRSVFGFFAHADTMPATRGW